MKHKHSVRLDLSDCLLSTAMYDVEIVGILAVVSMNWRRHVDDVANSDWTSIADPVIYIRWTLRVCMQSSLFAGATT